MFSRPASVEDEYAKDPLLRRDDVRILQEWMSKEPHLPRVDDLKIVLFLNSCYYNVEAAKKCIEAYYTLKTFYPPIFDIGDVDAQKFKDSSKAVYVYELPTSNDETKYVTLGLYDNDTDLCDIEAYMGYVDMVTHLLYMRSGACQREIVVLNGDGIKLGHVVKFTIMSTKVYLDYIQNAMPVRIKEVHAVNISAMGQKIFAIVKPFLNKELADAIKIHPTLERLHEHVPKEILPKEYGGDGPTFKELHDAQLKLIEENADYLRTFAAEKADESKRTGPRVDLNGHFGIEGTFKRLEID